MWPVEKGPQTQKSWHEALSPVRLSLFNAGKILLEKQKQFFTCTIRTLRQGTSKMTKTYAGRAIVVVKLSRWLSVTEMWPQHIHSIPGKAREISKTPSPGEFIPQETPPAIKLQVCLHTL